MILPETHQQDGGLPLSTSALFADLVRLHGEENGGLEDFYVLDETAIGCRYGDCSIRLKEEGWHYGGNVPAHPTPAQAFENRASDYHSANVEHVHPLPAWAEDELGEKVHTTEDAANTAAGSGLHDATC